ncbi:MAG: ATP phosphoribosyltransferase regulatory subunit [Flavonifractor plautii]
MRPGGAGELTGEQADGLRELVELYAPLKEGIGRVGRLAKSNAAWETLRQLSLTAGLLESFGLEERVRLDFSLVNSMDYYNGVIFQGFLPGLHTPVLSGGRYDNLPRKMGKQVGAIGFALSMGLLEERADGGRFDADVVAHLWARRGASRAGDLCRGPAGLRPLRPL